MQNLLTHKKWILFIALLIVLGMATPVLADYLGPNRTVTTTVSVCKVYLYKCTEVEPGKWKDVKVEDWLCSNESKPWEAYDSGGGCHSGNDGHKHWEKEDTIQTVTITHPPATITGSIQNCTLSNGWCGVTAPELALSANEPLAGYNITLIEGTLNGVSFACPSGASNCTLPMNQGDNTFNYWALSSWGDSSLMGTSSARVDTVPPDVSLSVTGTAGKNGWYKSGIQVAAIAQDVTSGVATFEVSVNGGGYQAYTDTTPIPFSSNALHTLQFRTMDNAGNLFETAVQNFYVDTIPPTVNLPASWQLGTNVPYDVIDEGSGLGALRIVIEDEDEKYAKVAWDQQVSGHTYSQDIDWNGQFKDKTVAPPGTYLVWLKASDVAGNEKFYLGKVIVPEPNYVSSSVLPTEAPVVVVEPPAPPAELTQPEDTTSLAPSTSAETTPTTQHFTLTSGTASGAAGAAAATTSGVLWGAAAAAAISAATTYALDVSRKREEAEEAQAAQVRAEVARGKAERAEKKQKQQENWNKQHPPQQNTPPPMPTGISPEAQQAYMHGGASAQGWINANVPQLQQAYVKQQEQQKEAAKKWAEKNKAEEQAAKNAQMLASLSTYRESEAQKQKNETVIGPAPEKKKPWWQKVGDVASDFVGPVVDGFVANQAFNKVKPLTFTTHFDHLNNTETIGISANLPKGQRADFFKEVIDNSDYAGLKPGGNVNPATVSAKVKSGITKVSKGTWITAGLVSFGVNLYDYGKDATSWADFSDKTFENREFWVSTAVDTVVSVAIGVGAAALAVALLPVAAPVAATVAVAAVIGIVGGLLFDAVGGPKLIKDGVNTVLDNLGLFR